MDVIVKGRQAAVTPQVRAYASEKLGKLDRYLPTLREAVVEVGREKTTSGRYIVQVTVDSNGTFLRAEERAAELPAAIDQAYGALSRQIERHKQRLYRHKDIRAARGARQAAEMSAAAEAAEEGGEPEEDEEFVLGKVVRVKHFGLKPMSVEEALEQMELLGHTFFLFLDASSQAYSLIYRRRDGDYGLIVAGPA